MDLQLTDRVALIVGGTGTIGSAIADALRAEGATVITAARGEGADLRLDAADPASVDSAIASLIETHGRIDALVVTAAPSAQTLDPARSGDPEQIIAAIEGKAMTFLRVVNAVAPHMKQAGFGRIVGISGQFAWMTGSITASVRNSVLNIAAKNLADDLAGSGVTVNTVNPGIVADEPNSAVKPGMGGESSPQQVADLVAFLLSPRSVVSGEQIAVAHRQRGVVQN